MPRSRPTPVTSLPSSSTSPFVGGSRPATALRIVDFPQPDGPRKTTISPQSGLLTMSNETSRTASVARPDRSRYVTDRLLTRSVGVAAAGGAVYVAAFAAPRSATVTATVPGSPACDAVFG